MMMIGPYQALWLLTLPRVGERPIDRKAVNEHLRRMKKGEFEPDPPLEFVIRDGRVHLSNGQHRLVAILKSGHRVLINTTLSID